MKKVEITIDLLNKYQQLQDILSNYSSVVIGFSGGVDSTFLSKVAYDILKDNSLAVIGISPSYPHREKNEAVDLAQQIGIRYITVETHEMNILEYRQNSGDRCYHCKKELYSTLQSIKEENNFQYILDGTNISDLSDQRPGFQATEELGVKKPLIEAQLSKEDIRLLSKYLGLPTWDKPSFACLSSRFPVGTEISEESLSQVEKGEDILHHLGFKQFRIRYHNKLARIELLEEDFYKLIQEETRSAIIKKLNEIGFQFVTLDLKGYRIGGSSR